MASKGEVVLNSRFAVIKKADVGGLKRFASYLSPEEKGLFNETYGNLLRLLRLEVQEGAIMALSKCYDPSVRCFLLKNFQLSPTLEEYEQILGFSRSGLAPYQYQKHQYTDQRLSLLLQVSVKELLSHKEKKGRITGFPLRYFEGFLESYAQANKWGPFKQLLALVIFGIVLFPQVEKFVDENALGIFLAFINKEGPINPVPAVLADTYYSFTHHRALGKKNIVCSLHVIYAWLLNHIITHQKTVIDLVDYALSCEVEVRTTQEWALAFEGLTAHKVNWVTQSCWKDRPSILFQCGNFPNVPLMGTRGCINYNPFMTLRQLGYSMKNAPTQDMLTPVFFDKDDAKNQALYQKVAKAWENPVYKGKDEITKKTSEITFYRWLHQRMQNASVPQQSMSPIEKEMPDPNAPIFKELSEVKTTLSKVEEEKKALQDKLGEVVSEKRKLERENEYKAQIIEESSKKLKKEEEDNQEMRKHMRGFKDELRRSNAKTGEALARANEWRGLYKESVKRERLAKQALEEFKKESHAVTMELENQLRCIKQDMNSVEGILREYQRVLKIEQEGSDELKRNLHDLSDAYRQVKEDSLYWERCFLELIGRCERHEVIIELRTEIQHWKDKFSKLAWLANQAVRDIPKRLREAEIAMTPFNTPVPVYKFVEFCRALTEELMDKARGAAAANKEKKKEEKLKTICF